MTGWRNGLRRVLFIATLPLFLGSAACGRIVPEIARPLVSRTNGEATIEVLDVGQGDSILIRSPEGKTALIDAGPSNHIVKLLNDRGLTSIDLVVVSHHHSDHYGGMRAVIRQFQPRFFMAANSPHATASYLKLLRDVESSSMKTIHPTAVTRRIELGSMVLTVFPEAPSDRTEENNNSVGIRLDYGSFSMLFTGDSEEKERRWWMTHQPDLIRDAIILKLAHHGSRNGTDEDWLDRVRPELAIASLGAGNDYGHPHRETVSLLAHHGIPLLRTDEAGSVTIMTDGKSWRYLTSEIADRPDWINSRGLKRSFRRKLHTSGGGAARRR